MSSIYERAKHRKRIYKQQNHLLAKLGRLGYPVKDRAWRLKLMKYPYTNSTKKINIIEK